MKDNITTISFRFLEIKDDSSWVIKKDEDHEDGYYKFLIAKDELQDLIDLDDPKLKLYKYFARDINRGFMEFMMLEMGLESSYIASILVDDIDEEYSYLEALYMEDTYLSDSVNIIYSEEIGMLSDFDYYPYGLE